MKEIVIGTVFVSDIRLNEIEKQLTGKIEFDFKTSGDFNEFIETKKVNDLSNMIARYILDLKIPIN